MLVTAKTISVRRCSLKPMKGFNPTPGLLSCAIVLTVLGMAATPAWPQYQALAPVNPGPALIEGIWALPLGGQGLDVVIRVFRRQDGFFAGVVTDPGKAKGVYRSNETLFVVRDMHKPDTFVGKEFSYDDQRMRTKKSLTLVVTGNTLSYRAANDAPQVLQRRSPGQLARPSSKDEQLRKLNQEFSNLRKNHALFEKLFYQANKYASQAEAAGNMEKAEKWNGKAQELSSRMATCREKMRLLEGEFNRVKHGEVAPGATPPPTASGGGLLGVQPVSPVQVPGR
jgi:hypothetical protein